VQVAEYGVRKFNSIDVKAWKNKHAITVVLPRPNERICRKWMLATQEEMAHIICMPHVSDKTIDEVVKDFKLDYNL
jgi:histidine decarboxylase